MHLFTTFGTKKIKTAERAVPFPFLFCYNQVTITGGQTMNGNITRTHGITTKEALHGT